MNRRLSMTVEAAEGLAVQALTYLAGDSERLSRFLVATGLEPGKIRAASCEPEFLVGVLDHLVCDERLLTDFADEAGIHPTDIGEALAALGGRREPESS